MRPIARLSPEQKVDHLIGAESVWPILPGWDFASQLANNPVSRYASIVPVIGYLILLSEDIRLIVPADRFGTLVGNTESKLILVYYGFIFLFIANAVFYFTKDKISKGADQEAFILKWDQTYNQKDVLTVSKYILKDMSVFGYYENNNFVKYDRISDIEETQTAKLIFNILGTCQNLLNLAGSSSQRFENEKTKTGSISLYYFLSTNYDRPSARAIIIFLAGTGFALIGAASLDTFLGVAEYTATRIIEMAFGSAT